MNKPDSRFALVFLLGLSLLLSACVTTQPVVGSSANTPTEQNQNGESSNTLQISDIPLPTGSKLNTESSLIMGSGDSWLGRIVLKTENSPIQAFNHFYNGMPSNGWGLVAAVQSKTSTLTYTRGERVATLQIEPSSLGGTAISITVTARQATKGMKP